MSLFVFILGLAIGSFLNVLIERLPKGESILGRSRCQNCKTKLNWQDLLPVFSFLLLRGRCRHCQSRISISYPVVEIVTAVLFLVFFKMSAGIFLFFFVSLLIVLAFADIKYFILPDKIILSGAVGLAVFLLLGRSTGVCHLNGCNFQSIVLGAAFFGGLFLALYFISSGKWIGLGDVKLGFLLGAIAGFYWVLNIFYISILLGTAASIFILAFGGSLKTSLPFGAFLSLSALITLLARIDFVGIILRF